MERIKLIKYILAATIIFLGFYVAPAWSLLIISSLLLIILIGNSVEKSEKRFIISLFLTGLSLRLAMLSIIHFNLIKNGFCPGAINTFLDSYEGAIFFDEHNFIRASREIALGIADFQQYYFRNAHIRVLSWLFSHFGYDPMIGKLINCLLGTMTAPIVYFCAKILYNDCKPARYASIITMFYPSVFFWSLTNLRDTILMCLAALFLLIFLNYCKRRRLVYLIYAFFVAWLTQGFRNGYFYIYSGFLVLAVLYLFFLSKISKLRFFLFGCIGFFIILATPVYKYADMLFSKVAAVAVDKQFCNSIAGESSGNYQLFTKAEIESKGASVTPISLFASYLKGVFYFMFSPFLWRNYNIILPLIMQTILWYSFIPFIFAGIYLSAKEGILGRLTFLFLIINISYLAILEGNIGTLFRHRDMIMPIFFLFLAGGLTFKPKLRS